LFEEVFDLDRLHEAVAAGDDESNPSPAMGDDGRQLVLQGAELQLVIPLARAGAVRLGKEKVAPSYILPFSSGSPSWHSPLQWGVAFAAAAPRLVVSQYVINAGVMKI
jgi:hypothetical protein